MLTYETAKIVWNEISSSNVAGRKNEKEVLIGHMRQRHIGNTKTIPFEDTP